MIPNYHNRSVTSGGVSAVGSFGISLKDAAHIMTILRDTLYSDKVMAVLREYSANAWDANRETGEKDMPIKVTLPTERDPVLSIQDFGPGLSRDDVFTVFTQYGASTKRETDDAVGMLGIGSKSGFAYSDSFTVISCHGGVRRTFVAILDETEVGVINLLHEEPCAGDTGVTIQIPVRQEDVEEFETKAIQLYQHFVPRPIINVELPDPRPVKASLKNGDIFESERIGWVAVMGCVPYRVNLEQLLGMDDLPVGSHLEKLSGVLYFNIGEVQVNASREELKYGDSTKKALVKKLNDLVDEYVTKTLADIEVSGLTQWEQRKLAQILNRLGIPVPTDRRGIVSHFVSVRLKTDEKTSDGKDYILRTNKFRLIRDKETDTDGLPVGDFTKIWIYDDRRALKGFRNLGHNDLILKPSSPLYKLDEAVADFKEVLTLIECEGVPIGKLSECTWTLPPGKLTLGKQINKKHNVRNFRLIERTNYSHPWSANWEIVPRTPTDDDVFVIISFFQPEYPFFSLYVEDLRLARAFGIQMPAVYGYKTTENKPLEEADCKGTEYRAWREKFRSSLNLNPAVVPKLNDWCWARYFRDDNNAYSYHRKDNDAVKKARCTEIISDLGKNHLVSTLLRRRMVADARIKKFTPVVKEALNVMAAADGNKLLDNSEASRSMAALLEKYPLFCVAGISALWVGDTADKWLDYVKTLDRIP